MDDNTLLYWLAGVVGANITLPGEYTHHTNPLDVMTGTTR